MTDGTLPPGEDITVTPNYEHGSVWLTIGDAPRKCLTPTHAHDLANAIVWRFGPLDDEPPGYETQQIVDDLRAAANAVENSTEGEHR